MKRSSIRSRPHRVTDDERAVYLAVELRDQGCMAPRLDPDAGECSGRLTRQHVRMQPGGRRTTSIATGVLLCASHHLETGWATSRHGLALQREYLRGLYPEAWS